MLLYLFGKRCVILFEYFLTVVQQIFSMFLMVMVGYALFKTKLVSDEALKGMSNLLMKIVTPMILVSSFQREYNRGLMIAWVCMFAVAALTYAIQIALAAIFYRDKNKHAFAENRMSIVMPNNRIPCISAYAGVGR